MVTRYEKQAVRFLIVDLDGTYIHGNTLHLYLTSALRHHLCRGHLGRCLGITLYMGLRLFRMIRHTTMKFRCLHWAGQEEVLLQHFAQRTLRRINPRVQQLIEEHEAVGGRTLLATAAADFYVPYLWHGGFVATRMQDNPNRRECRGTEKLRRVHEWLRKQEGVIDAVVTDSKDDLPLLMDNADGRNYWVERSGEIRLVHLQKI